MPRVRITLPAVSATENALDVSNSLLGVAGIESITPTADGLLVDYDADYTNVDGITTFVKRIGYPIESAEEER